MSIDRVRDIMDYSCCKSSLQREDVPECECRPDIAVYIALTGRLRAPDFGQLFKTDRSISMADQLEI
jgi:hypothetical protein